MTLIPTWRFISHNQEQFNSKLFRPSVLVRFDIENVMWFREVLNGSKKHANVTHTLAPRLQIFDYHNCSAYGSLYKYYIVSSCISIIFCVNICCIQTSWHFQFNAVFVNAKTYDYILTSSGSKTYGYIMSAWICIYNDNTIYNYMTTTNKAKLNSDIWGISLKLFQYNEIISQRWSSHYLN